MQGACLEGTHETVRFSRELIGPEWTLEENNHLSDGSIIVLGKLPDKTEPTKRGGELAELNDQDTIVD